MTPQPRVRETLGFWRELARVHMSDDPDEVHNRIEMAMARFSTWRRTLRWRVSPSVMNELRRHADTWWGDRQRWTPAYADNTMMGTPIVVDPEMMGHRISLETEASQIDREVEAESTAGRASVNVLVAMATRRWPHLDFVASEHESWDGDYWQVRIVHSHWAIVVGLAPTYSTGNMSMWADSIIEGVRDIHAAMAQGLLSDNPIL